MAASLEGISHENNLSSDTKMIYRTQFKLVVQERWFTTAVITINEISIYGRRNGKRRNGKRRKAPIRPDQSISNRAELLLVEK